MLTQTYTDTHTHSYAHTPYSYRYAHTCTRIPTDRNVHTHSHGPAACCIQTTAQSPPACPSGGGQQPACQHRSAVPAEAPRIRDPTYLRDQERRPRPPLGPPYGEAPLDAEEDTPGHGGGGQHACGSGWVSSSVTPLLTEVVDLWSLRKAWVKTPPLLASNLTLVPPHPLIAGDMGARAVKASHQAREPETRQHLKEQQPHSNARDTQADSVVRAGAAV